MAVELRVLELKLMSEMKKQPIIKKIESERRRFKPFSQKNNIDQWSDVLCSSVGFQRVTLIRLLILLRSSSLFSVLAF